MVVQFTRPGSQPQCGNLALSLLYGGSAIGATFSSCDSNSPLGFKANFSTPNGLAYTYVNFTQICSNVDQIPINGTCECPKGTVANQGDSACFCANPDQQKGVDAICGCPYNSKPNSDNTQCICSANNQRVSKVPCPCVRGPCDPISNQCDDGSYCDGKCCIPIF